MLQTSGRPPRIFSFRICEAALELVCVINAKADLLLALCKTLKHEIVLWKMLRLNNELLHVSNTYSCDSQFSAACCKSAWRSFMLCFIF